MATFSNAKDNDTGEPHPFYKEERGPGSPHHVGTGFTEVLIRSYTTGAIVAHFMGPMAKIYAGGFMKYLLSRSNAGV